MEENLHPIKVVSMRSGLSAHVIRVWERRYGAITPQRTETNRRLYSNEDIQRLTLMRLASERGHRIGQLARMTVAELKEILREDQHIDRQMASMKSQESKVFSANEMINMAMEGTKNLDEIAVMKALKLGAVQFGVQGLLDKVISPLAYQIGDHWLKGEIKVAHEHFTSSIIRQFLGEIGRPYAIDPVAPRIIVGTPAGQFHELGAVMVCTASTAVGWSCKYIGANIIAEEIAGAASQVAAKAVALSLVFPADDPNLEQEFLRLRQQLPPSTQIILGGRSALAYKSTAEKIGAFICRDLHSFYPILEKLRYEKTKILTL